MYVVEGRVYRLWGTGIGARSSAVLNGQADNVVHHVFWTDDERDEAGRAYRDLTPRSVVFDGTWHRRLQDRNGRYALEVRLLHDGFEVASRTEVIPSFLY